jgi:hypothetical protein
MTTPISRPRAEDGAKERMEGQHFLIIIIIIIIIHLAMPQLFTTSVFGGQAG